MEIVLVDNLEALIQSGILDEYGNQQQLPAAFRKTRDSFLPKGIVKIIK